jgi:hypothetical protein
MLIPDEFQVDDELWGAVRAQLVKTARGSATAWDRDRPQRILVKSLTDRGIPYLDLLPVLRSVPPLSDGKLHCYLRRDTHWNARGNRIAGAALGEFLRSLVN